MTTTDLATDQAEPLTLPLTRAQWLTMTSALCLAADSLVDDIQTADRWGLPDSTAAMMSAGHIEAIAEMGRLFDLIDLFLDTTTDD